MAMMVNGGYQSPGKIRNREEWEKEDPWILNF
jgi:hypothetical protein